MEGESEADGTRRDSRMIQPPRFDTVVTIFLALAGWHAGLARISDNSFFCHLATGRWILAHGIPRTDPFSFTAAGTRWVAESWLADLLYGVLDRRFGPAGILTMNAAVGAAIAALWYRLALRLSRDRVRALLTTLLSLSASFTMWSPRPLLFGILALLILVWIVETPDSIAGRTPILTIPPLIWLWANIHGSFVLGFIYVGLHGLGRLLDRGGSLPNRSRQLIAAMVAALALCLINPYGGAILIAPFRLLGHHYALSNVTEWRPPVLLSLQGAMYTLWVLVFVVAAVIGFGNIKLRGIIVGVPFLLIAFWAERNIGIATIVTFPIAARALRTEHERPQMRPAFNWIAAAFALALGGWWTMQAWAHPALDFREYPVAAMNAVESQGLLGQRLLTTDSWGDYIILRYGVRQRVFMDDRYDVYPADVTRDLASLLSGHGDWLRIVQQYGIDLVVWPSRDPALRILESAQGFQQRYEDQQAVVLVRAHLAGANGAKSQ
ncbi:MAG TPA: hypothetical protein VMB26_13100 [Candidatus Binataceae bacterium]|nr:hypothetical protein [Candidatus Binataceae bacterium]